MFFRILKKELKRKKTLNIILFLFIAMASMFLASSVSNLMTVTGAIDYFMEISKVPDRFVIAAITKSENDPIEDFLEDAPGLLEYEILDGFNITNDRIEIVKAESGQKKYERTNTLVVAPITDNFMKVFDLNGEPLQLSTGQIALSKLEAEENNLVIGDKIKITVGEVEQEFTVTALTKDVVFGSGMMGFKRHMLCEEDFLKYTKQNGQMYTRIYSMDFENEEAFDKSYQVQNFNIVSTIDGKETVPMCYVFDMLIAGILIIVSVCLILIAFFVLRFTIMFTLQGDFREIGIMKAIGLKDRGIRGIYLIKYLMLSVFGATVGLLFSFPFGKILMQQAVVNLVVNENGQNGIIHILCAAGIIAIVLIFANSCTKRLKKFSAIDAIRSGSNGERYQAKNRIKLWKRPHMKPGFYMAVNDIFSNPRQFLVLICTFVICTLLILLPLCAAHTLKGEHIIDLFSLSASDVYVDNGKGDDYAAGKDMTLIEEDLEEIEDTLKEHGITAMAGTDMGYMIPCYAKNEEELYTYYTIQETGSWERSYAVLEGREPEAEDELMITEITAEEMGVSIGDTVTFKLTDRETEFIITGTYQSMMNMGKGFRVSRKATLDDNYISGFLGIQIEIPDMETDEAYEKVKEIFPDYKVMKQQEFLSIMIGSILDQIDVVIFMIVAVVLVINSLITILTMKTMLSKEKGDVALLKSIGFRNISIQKWQVIRILLILFASIVMGTILSKLLAPVIIGPIFAMMGGNHVVFETKPLETYVIYPAILLIVTGISAFLCTMEVRKVDAKEVNNIE